MRLYNNAVPTIKMAAVFHRRHEGEGLRELNAFPFPFSETLLSSQRLERPSSSLADWAGRLASWLHSTGCPFRLAIPNTTIPGLVADSERFLYLP